MKSQAFFFICVLFCASCFSRSTLMTKNRFDTIQVGDKLVEVEKQVGKPYQVRKLDNGAEEYEYVERIFLGNETVQENHYYLVIKNGRVVGKKYKTDLPPAYDQIYDTDPNDTELQ